MNTHTRRPLTMLGAHPGEGCLAAVVRSTEGYSGSDLTELCAQVRLRGSAALLHAALLHVALLHAALLHATSLHALCSCASARAAASQCAASPCLPTCVLAI